MNVAACRHAKPTLERSRKIGNDIAEHVIGHNHVELLGIAHHVHA